MPGIENIVETVDRLYAESDARVFAILNKIANLAIGQEPEEPLSQGGPSVVGFSD